MKKVRIHAFISGRVQGVFYRVNTKKIAIKLNLTGWVRNLDDGRVEVVAEGEEEKINKLINYLWKGTMAARVDDVKVKKEEYRGEFEKFSITY